MWRAQLGTENIPASVFPTRLQFNPIYFQREGSKTSSAGPELTIRIGSFAPRQTRLNFIVRPPEETARTSVESKYTSWYVVVLRYLLSPGERYCYMVAMMVVMAVMLMMVVMPLLLCMAWYGMAWLGLI